MPIADGLDARSPLLVLGDDPVAARPLPSERDGSVARSTGHTRAVQDGRFIESTVPGQPRRHPCDLGTAPVGQRLVGGSAARDGSSALPMVKKKVAP